MGVIGWLISQDPVWGHGGRSLYKIALLGGGIAISILFYAGAMWALKSEELHFVWGIMQRRRQREA